MSSSDMNELEKSYAMQPLGDNVMSNAAWENFSQGDVIVFMSRYNLQKVSVEDGCGHKTTIKIDKDGQFKISMTTAVTQ